MTTRTRWLTRAYLGAWAWLMATAADAQDAVEDTTVTVRNTGVSGLWVLANVSYAGMRAQNSQSKGWRIIAFIFGLPGTISTWLIVKEGGERAYGVEIPRRKS